jgi:gas vesicle protein
MSQKTETVKNHSEALKNPLINLNEEIQRLEELLKSTSEKQSKHSNLLSCHTIVLRLIVLKR